MATSGDQGPVTAAQSAVALAVFSEPVTGLGPASFKTAGPPDAAVSAITLLRGTTSYYHILLTLPPSYWPRHPQPRGAHPRGPAVEITVQTKLGAACFVRLQNG